MKWQQANAWIVSFPVAFEITLLTLLSTAYIHVRSQGAKSPQISSMYYHFVFWKVVTQTKDCYSLKVLLKKF